MLREAGDAPRTAEFLHDLFHACGSLAELPGYGEVKRVNLGTNVLAV